MTFVTSLVLALGAETAVAAKATAPVTKNKKKAKAATKSRRSVASVPKIMAAPTPTQSEVKALLTDDSLDAAIKWVQVQKAKYEQRHVFFFDTTDKSLRKNGLFLRLRRKQDDNYDAVVKVRKDAIKELPGYSSKSAKNIACEMDLQLEQEDRASCSFERKEKKILPSLTTDNPDAFFSSDQERFAKFFYPEFRYANLKNQGRINSVVWELEDTTNGEIAFEVWTLPNGRRIGEFSLKTAFANADKATATLAKQIADWGFKIDKQAPMKSELAY